MLYGAVYMQAHEGSDGTDSLASACRHTTACESPAASVGQRESGTGRGNRPNFDNKIHSNCSAKS